MRRFTAGLICLVILAATAAAQAPASWPKVWNLAHPNATALIGQEEIDGALVGGASLKAADFASIVSQTARIRSRS